MSLRLRVALYQCTIYAFTGQCREIASIRQAALDAQHQKHPQRFVNGSPKAALPPAQVVINPIATEDGNTPETQMVNFPTLLAARKALQRFL